MGSHVRWIDRLRSELVFRVTPAHVAIPSEAANLPMPFALDVRNVQLPPRLRYLGHDWNRGTLPRRRPLSPPPRICSELLPIGKKENSNSTRKTHDLYDPCLHSKATARLSGTAPAISPRDNEKTRLHVKLRRSCPPMQPRHLLSRGEKIRRGSHPGQAASDPYKERHACKQKRRACTAHPLHRSAPEGACATERTLGVRWSWNTLAVPPHAVSAGLPKHGHGPSTRGMSISSPRTRTLSPTAIITRRSHPCTADSSLNEATPLLLHAFLSAQAGPVRDDVPANCVFVDSTSRIHRRVPRVSANPQGKRLSNSRLAQRSLVMF